MSESLTPGASAPTATAPTATAPTAAQPAPRAPSAASPELLAIARGRLSDRGIDPSTVIGRSVVGDDVTVAGFYLMLGAVGATEKAGQDPTFALARLALAANLPSEIADTLFLAYNQQSAEEAGHGDKVFGNAYYAMGGSAPGSDQSVVGNNGASFLLPTDDKKQNRKLLCGVAGVLGGIETVALNRVFPNLVTMCEAWGHPIARDLHNQIRDTVRPEESRHVLIWRYVFHQLIAPKGDAIVEAFRQATNSGRRQVLGDELDHDAFMRMMGSSSPTPRQLLGKDRVAV
jgi:hypothetical protein